MWVWGMGKDDNGAQLALSFLLECTPNDMIRDPASYTRKPGEIILTSAKQQDKESTIYSGKD